MSDAPQRPADPADPAADPVLMSRIAEGLASFVPHNRAIGLRFLECVDGAVTVVLPWDQKLVGNPLTRVLHGGAITTLMDATCGTAVFVRLREPIPIATLDLRIDYLKPATPEKEVHARAECFKITQNVAFVRCETYHPPADGAGRDLVATATGTFIIFRGQTMGRRRRSK